VGEIPVYFPDELPPEELSPAEQAFIDLQTRPARWSAWCAEARAEWTRKRVKPDAVPEPPKKPRRVA